MPLMLSLKTKNPILSEVEIKSLFSDLGHIFEFHMKVLKPEIHTRVVRPPLTTSSFMVSST